ncbi:hypothetical protein AB6A40_000572 [Gnathostoma spinigerum]|uniref:RNA-binding protein 42 n=1 Tax=Gnathostoma spinigerum TaxID=75299 RepID=A0ABD6E2G1_9BILA
MCCCFKSMAETDSHTLEDEIELFEKELSSLDKSHSATSNPASSPTSSPAVEVQTATTSSAPLTTVTRPSVISAPVSGPVLPSNSIVRPEIIPPILAGLRPHVPPFLPHIMIRPGYWPPPPPNLAMRFIPPQLRLPIPGFMRPSIAVPRQPAVLESGPSLYKDAEKKEEKDNDKETESSKSPQKTQVLSSDVELVTQKKHAETANKSSYIGQVLRGEKKMKRFLRCGGGQVWEDNSLAEWDPNDFRIFCGDLGNEVSDELLAKAFRKYPSFQKAKVIRESRTNKSKGYGFVSFKHQDDFVRACREMDGKYVGNRPIKLRKSNWKDRSMEVVKKKQKQKLKLEKVQLEVPDSLS